MCLWLDGQGREYEVFQHAMKPQQDLTLCRWKCAEDTAFPAFNGGTDVAVKTILFHLKTLRDYISQKGMRVHRGDHSVQDNKQSGPQSSTMEARGTTSLGNKFTSKAICLQIYGQFHAKEEKQTGQRPFPECSGRRVPNKATSPHSREWWRWRLHPLRWPYPLAAPPLSHWLHS